MKKIIDKVLNLHNQLQKKKRKTISIKQAIIIKANLLK